MKTWIYCDNCESTQPLRGDLMLTGVDDWKDLCCSVCAFVVATISAGDDEGNKPPSCDAPIDTAAPKRSAWTEYMQSEAGKAEYAAVERSLLRPVNEPLPEGCHCQPGKCAAPVIMGRQMPCRDPQKAAATAPAPPACARCKGTRYVNEKRWQTYETDTAEERADARQCGPCPDCAAPTAKEP